MIDLVIFTCEGRELLLQKTIDSFRNASDLSFDKIILAIDGQISLQAIAMIKPDLVVQSYKRKGYVNNITAALKQVSSPYFLWLEDDWIFLKKLDATYILGTLEQHPDWSEIVLSKTGPLVAKEKEGGLIADNLYNNINGFSANPCFCNTKHLQEAFRLLELAPKGGKLGEDGFENFLTKTFANQNLKNVILDPVDHLPISHEGFLESTPRNWHMTNSLEEKNQAHMLTIPAPSVARKIYMILKMSVAFVKLSALQLFSDKLYELCFRIIVLSKTIKENE